MIQKPWGWDLKPAAAAAFEPLHYSARAFSLRERQSPQLYRTQNDSPRMDHKNLGADLRRVSKLSRTGRLVWKERNEGGKGGGGRKKEKNLSLHRPRKYSKMSGPYTRGRSLKWNVGEKLEVLF